MPNPTCKAILGCYYANLMNLHQYAETIPRLEYSEKRNKRRATGSIVIGWTIDKLEAAI
jgi:hypothetical protein